MLVSESPILENGTLCVEVALVKELEACNAIVTFTTVPPASAKFAPGTFCQLLYNLVEFWVVAYELPPADHCHPVGPEGNPVEVSVKVTSWDIKTLEGDLVNDDVITEGFTTMPLELLNEAVIPSSSVTVRMAVYDPGLA
jgi:hypothetical protein